MTLIMRKLYGAQTIMAIRVVEFSSRGTKLEKILHKNQHTQRKSLNFEFWINGELSKIGHHFSNKKFLKIDFSNAGRKTILRPKAEGWFCVQVGL